MAKASKNRDPKKAILFILVIAFAAVTAFLV
jgi:hypothetical protein